MQTINRVVWAIGQGYRADGTPISASDRAELRHRTLALIASQYGGSTAWDASGSWLDSDGKLVSEDSWEIETYTDHAEMAHDTARQLAAMWSQSSVLVTISPVASMEFTAPIPTMAAVTA